MSSVNSAMNIKARDQAGAPVAAEVAEAAEVPRTTTRSRKTSSKFPE